MMDIRVSLINGQLHMDIALQCQPECVDAYRLREELMRLLELKFYWTKLTIDSSRQVHEFTKATGPLLYLLLALGLRL